MRKYVSVLSTVVYNRLPLILKEQLCESVYGCLILLIQFLYVLVLAI